MKKVLFLSIYDYAGSGHRYSEAVNRCKKYKSTSIKFFPHQYGYPSDFCIFENYQKLTRKQLLDRVYFIQEMINSADILHFKGDYPVKKFWGVQTKTNKGYFLNRNYPVLRIPTDKPIVITTSGSNFRRHIKDSVLSQCAFPMEVMMRHTNARTVTTPDLNYKEFDSEWLPLPLDIHGNENEWKKNNHKEVVVGHSPSQRGKKGTNTTLLPAFKVFQKFLLEMKIKSRLDIIENVSYLECLERKKKCTIFWDQSGFGFYGNSLVEAAGSGIPSMAWISDHSMNQMSSEHKQKLSVTSFVKHDPRSCAENMIQMFEQGLDKLSDKTYEWAKKTHSYESVGEKINSIYDKIC